MSILRFLIYLVLSVIIVLSIAHKIRAVLHEQKRAVEDEKYSSPKVEKTLRWLVALLIALLIGLVIHILLEPTTTYQTPSPAPHYTTGES